MTTVSCQKFDNQGGKDQVKVTIKISNDFHGANRQKSSSGSINTALIIAIPDVTSDVGKETEFSNYFDIQLQDLTSNTVTMTLPLHEPIRLVKKTYSDFLGLAEVNSSSFITYIGISGPFTIESYSDDKTVSIALNSTTRISFKIENVDWAAYQVGSANNWTKATLTDDVLTFNVVDTVKYGVVYRCKGINRLYTIQYTWDDLHEGTIDMCRPTYTISGTVTEIQSDNHAEVSAYNKSTWFYNPSATPLTQTFSISGIPKGMRDVVAAEWNSSENGSVNELQNLVFVRDISLSTTVADIVIDLSPKKSISTNEFTISGSTYKAGLVQLLTKNLTSAMVGYHRGTQGTFYALTDPDDANDRYLFLAWNSRLSSSLSEYFWTKFGYFITEDSNNPGNVNIDLTNINSFPEIDVSGENLNEIRGLTYTKHESGTLPIRNYIIERTGDTSYWDAYISPSWLGSDTTYFFPDLSNLDGWNENWDIQANEQIYWHAVVLMMNLNISTNLQTSFYSSGKKAELAKYSGFKGPNRKVVDGGLMMYLAASIDDSGSSIFKRRVYLRDNGDVVYKISAKVKVTDYNVNGAGIGARISMWFHPEEYLGQESLNGFYLNNLIYGHDDNPGLQSTWGMGKCTNADCTTYEGFTAASKYADATTSTEREDILNTSQAVLLNESHTLGLECLASTNQVTISLDGFTYTFDPTSDLPDFKCSDFRSFSLYNRIDSIDATGDSASMTAIYDDIYVNDVLYDDFSNGYIDLSKWNPPREGGT